MTDELVEAVARGAAIDDGQEPDALCPLTGEPNWKSWVCFGTAAIQAIRDAGWVVIDARKLRKELNYRVQQVGAIRIPASGDETLACVICDLAENPDQEEEDDYGRTPDALDALDAFEASVADLFEPVKTMIQQGQPQ